MFKRFLFRSRIATLLVAPLLALITLASPVMACTHPDPPPPVICIYIIDNTHIIILIKNYRTANAVPGVFCTCALHRVAAIQSIDSARILFGGTQTPVPGWNFVINPLTGQAYTQAANNGTWDGFSSPVTQPIEGQQLIDLEFHCTVLAGTTFQQIAQSLAMGGTIVGNGEASSQGVPFAPEFRPAGQIILAGGIPTISQWGMIILSLALAVVGTVAIRRRARQAAA